MNSRGVGELQPLLDDFVVTHPDFESFTTFEAMTALALNFFARTKIDVAILEVGLGGRLGATNVVDADLSLITPISFDHTNVLGNTLHKIAFEKAGIVKEGKIVLSAPQHPDALAVIEEAAQEKRRRLAFPNAIGFGSADTMILWLPQNPAPVCGTIIGITRICMCRFWERINLSTGLAVAAARDSRVLGSYDC